MRLHAIADQAEPDLRAAILQAIADTVRGVDMVALKRALDAGNLDAAMRAIPWTDTGEAALRSAYRAILTDTYLQAGDLSAESLGDTLGRVGISFDLTNPRAEAWAENVGATRVVEVSDETVAAIRSFISESFEIGRHPYQTASALMGEKNADGIYDSSIIGLTEHQAMAVGNYRVELENDEIERSTEVEDRLVQRYANKLLRNRAETISRNETLKSSSEGQRELWLQARENGFLRGDEKRVWIVTPDDRLCELCRAMGQDYGDADQAIPLDEPYLTPDGEEILVPTDIHIQCFLPGTLVEGAFVSGLKARYAGPVVEIKSLKGHRLRVTPNHPVLTPRGWVAAGALLEGDNVLSQPSVIQILEAVDGGNNQHSPAMIEQVFDALAAGGLTSRQIGRLDLHGDARFTQGYVDIVNPFPTIRGRGDAEDAQGVHNLHDVLADVDERSVYSLGSPHLLVKPVDAPPARLPGSGTLPLDERTVLLERDPLQVFRSGATSDWHMPILEQAVESTPAHAAFIAQLLQRSAGQITLDQVISIRKFEFDGHVYDLQSTNGWMIAQNIITSNCRCAEGLVDPFTPKENP